MTAEAIYRELCIIDPALEPYEKCTHRWQANPDNSHDLYDQICAKCGDEGSTELGLPEFGDREPKYQSVDELLSLCNRIGMMTLKTEVCIGIRQADCRVTLKRDGAFNDGMGVGYAIGLREELPPLNVAALSEAILRAMGRWTE